MQQSASPHNSAATRDSRGALPAVNRTMGLKEWGLIIVLSIIWGGSFFFIGVAVREMTPLTIVLCRVGLASLVLLAYVHLTGRRLPSSPKLWCAFLCMGLLNNLMPFSLIVWGQQYIASSLASILNATTPIFAVVLAHFLTREERLTANRAAGVVIGWLGVAVLLGVASLKGIGLNVWGQVAVLGASCSYALAAIYGRRFKDLSPVVVSTGMLCSSTMLMLPVALLIEKPWHLSPSLLTLSAILGLAVISTSIAYIIYFRVLATAGATNILLVTFLIPLSAILLGVFILGESLGWNILNGMLLIFIGLIAIDGRLLARLKRKPPAAPMPVKASGSTGAASK